jgi:hypothetical protein
MSQLTSEHASTGRRYSVARGAVAFLLFLLPKLSDEAEQRQQMVPRALRLLDFFGSAECGLCGWTSKWPAFGVRDELGCQKVDRRERRARHLAPSASKPQRSPSSTLNFRTRRSGGIFFAGLAPQLREAFVDLWLSGMLT